MKKLMTLMLGLAFLCTTVAVSYAQETKDTSTAKKKSKGKKASPKSTDTAPKK